MLISTVEKIRATCLDEIANRKSVLFAPCVDDRHQIVVNGEIRRLRPIMFVGLPLGSRKFLHAAAHFMVELGTSYRATGYCGLATQGIPLATTCGVIANCDAPYFRSESTGYGPIDRLLGGTPPLDASKIVLVDNVLYSGATLAAGIAAARARGWGVSSASVVVEFTNPIRRVNNEIQIHSLLSTEALVDGLLKRSVIPRAFEPSIMHFLADQTAFFDGSDAHRRWLDLYQSEKTQ